MTMPSGPDRQLYGTSTIGLRVRRRLAWLVRHLFRRAPLILMYHRVTNLPADPYFLAVTPAHFAEHLELLRKRYRVLPLRRLVETATDRWSRRCAVAVTFDDGYADNLYHAKPLLERHGLPATVFVTTGQIAGRSELWWDELERLLLQPGRLPSTLRVDLAGRHYEWELGAAADYGEEAFERHRRWHLERPDDPTARQHLLRSLYHVLHAMQPSERAMLVEELQQWAGAEGEGRRSHRTLTVEELVDLENGELIEVGAHTVSHAALGDLPVSVQRHEILESKRYLEAALQHPVTSFAYPHGSATTRTVALVREAGFVRACSSVPSLVAPHSDPCWLPRVEIRDCDGEAFARTLRAWFGS